MKVKSVGKDKVLWAFVATLALAIFLRLFVFEVVSVSSDALVPQFYPGDFLLISKLSTPVEGRWVLLRDYPQKGLYSVRKLSQPQGDNQWEIDLKSRTEGDSSQDPSHIQQKDIVGQVLWILWSLPCKPEAVSQGQCPSKKARFFKPVH